MNFGCHVSISGGLEKAIERGKDLGCESIQIFASNPRGWKVRPLEVQKAAAFRRAREGSEIQQVAVHSTYLVNLASSNSEIRSKSYQRFKEDLLRADQIGAEYMILHPGSHGEAGLEVGLKLVAESLSRLKQEVEFATMVLLEIEAGGGTEIGGTWENLSRIMELIPDSANWIGFCLDTCHAFASGYDLRREEGWLLMLEKINSLQGKEVLKMIHANDAQGTLGDHLDRHAHIGKGSIGTEGFMNMMRQPELTELPVVLETPENDGGNFSTNLSTLRRIWEES